MNDNLDSGKLKPWPNCSAIESVLPRRQAGHMRRGPGYVCLQTLKLFSNRIDKVGITSHWLQLIMHFRVSIMWTKVILFVYLSYWPSLHWSFFEQVCLSICTSYFFPTFYSVAIGVIKFDSKHTQTTLS